MDSDGFSFKAVDWQRTRLWDAGQWLNTDGRTLRTDVVTRALAVVLRWCPRTTLKAAHSRCADHPMSQMAPRGSATWSSFVSRIINDFERMRGQDMFSRKCWCVVWIAPLAEAVVVAEMMVEVNVAAVVKWVSWVVVVLKKICVCHVK